LNTNLAHNSYCVGLAESPTEVISHPLRYTDKKELMGNPFPVSACSLGARLYECGGQLPLLLKAPARLAK